MHGQNKIILSIYSGDWHMQKCPPWYIVSLCSRYIMIAKAHIGNRTHPNRCAISETKISSLRIIAIMCHLVSFVISSSQTSNFRRSYKCWGSGSSNTTLLESQSSFMWIKEFYRQINQSPRYQLYTRTQRFTWKTLSPWKEKTTRQIPDNLLL